MSGNQNGRSGEQNGEAMQECFSQCSRNLSRLGNDPGLPRFLFPFSVGCVHPLSFQLLLACAFAFGLAATASAGDLRIEGTLIYTEMLKPNETSSRIERPFSAVISDCQWKIQTIGGNKETISREWAFNGTNLFFVTHYDTNKIAAFSGSHPKLAISGAIYDGEVPPYEPSYVAALWLAYGSSCYLLSRADAGTIKPIWYVDKPIFEDERFSVKAWWSFDAAGLFPTNVVFFSHVDVPKVAQDGDIVTHKRKAPYQDGFTNAEYSVDSYEALDGVEIPSRFRLVVFTPSYEFTNTPATRVLYTIEGHATSLRSSHEIADMRPDLGGAAAIRDERLSTHSSSRPVLRYTSAEWVETNDSRIAKSLDSQIKIEQRLKLDQNSQGASSRGPSNRKFVIAIMAGVTVGALWVLVNSFLKSKKTSTS